jgi:hypothetical protein
VDLFQFNDDFIAAATWGSDNDETVQLFVEAIQAGADELERRLIDAAGPDVAAQAQFSRGGRIFGRGVFFDIPLTQDQYDSEIGSAGEPPNPAVRRAIISATIPASRAMSRVLGGD